MSKDPKGISGGDVNLYRYVSNRPISKTDPFGLAEFPHDQGAVPAFQGAISREFIPSSSVTNITPMGFIGMVFAMPAVGAAASLAAFSAPYAAVGIAAASSPVTIANSLDFADSVSGEISGPTTGMPPSTLGGALGVGLGRYLNDSKVCK